MPALPTPHGATCEQPIRAVIFHLPKPVPELDTTYYCPHYAGFFIGHAMGQQQGSRIEFGDCRETMRRWAADGVKAQMCVTSPPYFGLRDYNHDGQIGLEQTPEQYIAAMVEVFRCVWDVLADDGTLWLNCGDSYSTGVPNIANLLQSDFEKGVFFFGSANPRGRTAERINVLIYDKRSPNLVFKPLFTAQRVSIKQGKHDLCEIGGALDAPIQHFISCTIGSACPDNANAELCMDVTEHIGIVVAAGDLHADASLRRAIALSIKNSKTTLSIEIAAEPIAKGVPSAVPAFDAVTFNTAAKSRAKVDAVNNAVSLLDGAELSASQCGNFAVREATSEKLSLRLHGGADVCFIGVGHLFLFEVGLSPYAIILDKAQRKWNAQRPKQELGIPEILKRALMEDGWICRQTIIWHKPNPMPESVRDRCTKAHEQIFLLTKQPRYYFDNEAIKTPVKQDWGTRDRQSGKYHNEGTGLQPHSGLEKSYEMANKRSVWSVNTRPYKGAHFATFPAELIEPCILAGSRAGDVVLDPFMGSGTTAGVALKHGRQYLGCELNPDYGSLQAERIASLAAPQVKTLARHQTEKPAANDLKINQHALF